MAERIVNGYRRLFELRLLHHYWLDEGAKCFDVLPKDEQARTHLPPLDQKQPTREEKLFKYDCRKFLTVKPTAATEKLLKGLQCVCKPTALGMVVAIPPGIKIEGNPSFEFVVTVQDADFFTYTALTFNKRTLHEHLVNGEVFRYKENVFVFENTSGTVKGGELFLSRDMVAISSTSPFVHAIESLFTSTASTPLLLEVADNAGSTTTLYQSMAASALPVFVNQHDIPPVALPAGVSGSPIHGMVLNQEIPDDVFAVIRISAEHPTEQLLSCISGGFAFPTAPVFQIRFKNRSTTWRYRDSKNPSLTPTDVGPFPLTYYGNASSPTKQKPVGGITADVNGNQVTKLVSEIII